MNRPRVVRAVALLLVLIGLQAGSFRDPDTGDERYYGTSEFSAAVAMEAGTPHVLPPAVPAAPLPRAARLAHTLPVPTVRAEDFHLPEPTGPPRA